MKLLILSLIMVFSFSGCAEKVYGTGKVIYVGARTAYIELDIDNPQLEAMDKVIVTYDKSRTAMVDEIERQKSKKKVSVSSSRTQE